MMLRRTTTLKRSSCNKRTTWSAKSPIKYSPEFNHNESQLAHRSAKTSSNSKATTTPRSDSYGGFRALSMRPPKSVSPDSVSPICSHGSSPLRATTEFSIARNQSSCTVPFDAKRSNSTIEIDEWIDTTKKFCRFFYPNLQKYHPKGSNHELPSLPLPSPSPSIEEGSSVGKELSHLAYSNGGIRRASEVGSPSDERHKLLTRPKPYHAFLDEVKRQEHEAEIGALKKAKYVKLMDRLKTKEAAIDEWEFKKTKKAMKEIEEIESKLERNRAQALEKAKERIKRANKEANNKKTKVRRSTIGKISTESNCPEMIRATKSSIWLKFWK